MDDTISRQSAIDAANRVDYIGLDVEDVKWVIKEVVKELKKVPSAQPDRKRGKWIKWGTELKCDQCYLCNSVEKPYCPNCGAEMEREDG